MYAQHNLVLLLTAAVISAGFLTLSVEGQTCSAGAGCLNCSASNSADCTTCSSGLGLTIGSPHSCLACNTNPTCANCTSLSLCTQCVNAAYSPYQNGTAACGPCSSNCSSCTTNGAGKCDVCSSGFVFDSSTKMCDTCKVVNCSNCATSGVNFCDSCISGNFPVAGSNKTKCSPCSPNCRGCAMNGGGFCDYGKCFDPYGFNNATKFCAPCSENCTSCNINGYGLCDPGKCSPGYAINSSKLCEPCSMYCSMCNATGPQLCDGSAFCSSVSTYNAGTKKCDLITTTPGPTTTVPFTGSTVPPANYSGVVTRDSWGSVPGAQLPTLTCPQYIVIHHSRTNCSTSANCISLIKATQAANRQLTDTLQDKPIRDIVYNFLIDPFGTIYQGVGWEFQGQHTYGLNDNSVGVAFIGTFSMALPTSKALAALDTLINMGLPQIPCRLSPTYKIYPHKDVQCTTCPGGKLYTYLTEHTKYGGKVGKPYIYCQSYGSAIHPQK